MERPTVFRFSLLAIFALTTVVAVWTAILFTVPTPYSGVFLIFLFQLVPAVLLAGIIWGSRYVRAFCIGAIIPSAITLLTMAPVWLLTMYLGPPYRFDFEVAGIVELLDEYDSRHRFLSGASGIFSLLLGLATLAMRRYVFWKED